MNTFVAAILCLRGVSLCTDEAREEVDVRDGAGVDNVLEPAMTTMNRGIWKEAVGYPGVYARPIRRSAGDNRWMRRKVEGKPLALYVPLSISGVRDSSRSVSNIAVT